MHMCICAIYIYVYIYVHALSQDFYCPNRCCGFELSRFLHMSLPVVVPPLPAGYGGHIASYAETVSTHWFLYEHIAHMPLRKPAFAQFHSTEGCYKIGIHGRHTVVTFTHRINFVSRQGAFGQGDWECSGFHGDGNISPNGTPIWAHFSFAGDEAHRLNRPLRQLTFTPLTSTGVFLARERQHGAWAILTRLREQDIPITCCTPVLLKFLRHTATSCAYTPTTTVRTTVIGYLPRGCRRKTREEFVRSFANPRLCE